MSNSTKEVSQYLLKKIRLEEAQRVKSNTAEEDAKMIEDFIKKNKEK